MAWQAITTCVGRTEPLDNNFDHEDDDDDVGLAVPSSPMPDGGSGWLALKCEVRGLDTSAPVVVEGRVLRWCEKKKGCRGAPGP